MSGPSAMPLAAVIVMGVAGAGKTTIAEALARRLKFTYRDGDDFHPLSNIEKMRAGLPLPDQDRAPWLAAIAGAIDRAAEMKAPVVIACSALKRRYRDALVHGRNDVRFIYLKGSKKLIADRMAARQDHFMPPSLLDSQFATLEEPAADEPIITMSIDRPVERIVNDILDQLTTALDGTSA